MGFRDDLATAAAEIRDEVGVPITYTRGAASAAITKAVKFPRSKRAQFTQVAVDLTLQDWGIAVADLVLSGAETEPLRNDRITDTESGEIYEVLPDEGDSVSHPMAADSQYRIHTKRVS